MVSSPIKVKDYINPIESTRQELFREEDMKIQGNRGFIFKGFKTEKERIEEHIKTSNFVFADVEQKVEENKRKKKLMKSLNTSADNISVRSTINRDQSPIHTKNNQSTVGKNSPKHRDSMKNLNPSSSIDKRSIVQPYMRYKPRTDLERIYESINKNSFGRVNKNVVEKQLRGLDLNYAKKKEEEDFNPEDDLLELAMKKKVDSYSNGFAEDNIQKESKEKINNEEKRLKLNLGAKNLMSDLHNKTHFKGASVLANKIGNKNKK